MRSKERIRSGNCGRWLHLEKCGRRSTFFFQSANKPGRNGGKITPQFPVKLCSPYANM
jgi:hypothetical protein